MQITTEHYLPLGMFSIGMKAFYVLITRNTGFNCLSVVKTISLRRERYVVHHLKLAGAKEPLLDEQAFDAAYQVSFGIYEVRNELMRSLVKIPVPLGKAA